MALAVTAREDWAEAEAIGRPTRAARAVPDGLAQAVRARLAQAVRAKLAPVVRAKWASAAQAKWASAARARLAQAVLARLAQAGRCPTLRRDSARPTRSPTLTILRPSRCPTRARASLSSSTRRPARRSAPRSFRASPRDLRGQAQAR